jgi:hypothetical protein
MAITKSVLSVFTTTTTTATSSTQTISGAYAADYYISIVQTGTATTGATVQPSHSPDNGTTFYNGPVYTAGLSAATYTWFVSIPSDATQTKLIYTTQAGGTSSVINAQISQITSL